MSAVYGPTVQVDFPSFSEGLSLRVPVILTSQHAHRDFPSFSEGLSLRAVPAGIGDRRGCYFPSFSEGLSLRDAPSVRSAPVHLLISLPFRRDFH